jgi:LuxR family maltose regulon positive regulatory protein
LVLEALGNLDQALVVLSHALTLAESQGFRRVFLDKGWPVIRLLHELVNQNRATDFVRQLVNSLEESRPDKPSMAQQNLVESLSARELQVLQLLSQGLSNREIGERLFLALDTVKGHNRRIYGKLGVRNRTQAVNKARTLGLL